MKNENRDDLDRDLRRIAGAIAGLPDREPPDDVIDAVMARIEPKRVSRLGLWWRRMRISAAAVPLQAASAAAVVVLVLLGAFALTHRNPEQLIAPALTRASAESASMVVFTLNAPDASKVELIGSFNHWRPGDMMSWDNSRKAWVASLNLQRGRYEYAFLVDGQKVVPDPNALINRDDGFGNQNSVLIVERNPGHETGI